jgi:glutathione S-transferase
MKLYYSPTSPFVRKVLIAAFETGLYERIEKLPVQNSPTQPSDALNQTNPLGKIPTLIADDGLELFDSQVICEYLDTLHRGPKLIPATGPARWKTLRLHALADGVMDAAVLMRYEVWLRPAELRWQDWIQGQTAKIERGLAALERDVAGLDDTGDTIDLGTISLACALGYLDLRFPDMSWRAQRPQLAAWLARFAERPSFQATQPPA